MFCAKVGRLINISTLKLCTIFFFPIIPNVKTTDGIILLSQIIKINFCITIAICYGSIVDICRNLNIKNCFFINQCDTITWVFNSKMKEKRQQMKGKTQRIQRVLRVIYDKLLE